MDKENELNVSFAWKFETEGSNTEKEIAKITFIDPAKNKINKTYSCPIKIQSYTALKVQWNGIEVKKALAIFGVPMILHATLLAVFLYLFFSSDKGNYAIYLPLVIFFLTLSLMDVYSVFAWTHKNERFVERFQLIAIYLFV